MPLLRVKNPTAANIDQFKRFRNLYSLVIKTAKKLYYEKQQTLNQKNLRKTWQILFSSINKSKINRQDLSQLTINGLDVSNKSPTELISRNPNYFSLSEHNVTKTEILEATKLLKDKKTPDHTGISTNFIKQTIQAFINPFHHILNLSFTTGKVPMQFKIAKVIPIFKAGDKSQMDNYRPISLLINLLTKDV